MASAIPPTAPRFKVSPRTSAPALVLWVFQALKWRAPSRVAVCGENLLHLSGAVVFWLLCSLVPGCVATLSCCFDMLRELLGNVHKVFVLLPGLLPAGSLCLPRDVLTVIGCFLYPARILLPLSLVDAARWTFSLNLAIIHKLSARLCFPPLCLSAFFFVHRFSSLLACSLKPTPLYAPRQGLTVFTISSHL
jgi:hypothetical protein